MTAASVLLFDRFTRYLADGVRLDPGALTEDARLDDDLGLDSFDMVEILTRVEELGVRLPDEVVMEVQTVGDLYRQYAARARGAAPHA